MAASKIGGDPEEARSYYERAVALDDSLQDAKTNLAAILIRTGELEEAVALCESVLVSRRWVSQFTGNSNYFPALSMELKRHATQENEQFNAPAWYNLNTAMRQLGRTDDAIGRSWTALEVLTHGAIQRPALPELIAAPVGVGFECLMPPFRICAFVIERYLGSTLRSPNNGLAGGGNGGVR